MDTVKPDGGGGDQRRDMNLAHDAATVNVTFSERDLVRLAA